MMYLQYESMYRFYLKLNGSLRPMHRQASNVVKRKQGEDKHTRANMSFYMTGDFTTTCFNAAQTIKMTGYFNTENKKAVSLPTVF